MIKLTIRNQPVTITGDIIKVGDVLNFQATDRNLKTVTLNEFKGTKKIISSVPSIDTGTCALQTVHFNEYATTLKNMQIISISKDLPFAQSRFCEKLKLNKNVHIWSDYRNDENNFSNTTKLIIDETQLLARTVIVLDENNKVLYLQIVTEITKEPEYEKVISFIKNI